MKRFLGLALVALASFAVVGCNGSSLKTEMVVGVVTLDGTPVEGATVTFSPTSGGVPAIGQTDKDGKYTLTSQQGGAPGKGAVVGEYQVGIVKSVNTAPQPTQEELEKASAEGRDITKEYPPQYEDLVPKQYKLPQFSGLTASVQAGSNTFDFELTSE